MSKSRTYPVSLNSNGVQRLASTTTGTAVNATIQAGRALLISVETQDVRVRFDSTAPTANTGIILQAGADPFWHLAYDGAAIKFRSVLSTAGIVQVESFIPAA